MDSGNSGSLQSSSGGDDEYDSRSESISAFLMGGALRNQQQSQSQSQSQSQLPPPPLLSSSSSSSHHQHHQQQQQHPNPNHPTSLFDPLSNYFDVFSSRSTPPPNNPNSTINLDMGWSRDIRSEPNSNTDHVGALLGSNSSTSSHPIMFGGSRSRGDINAVVSMHQNLNPPSTSSPISLPPHQSASASASASASDQPRQSKKRSRASRRAPTTVLTTDTSNFRAMVQQFTGIAGPPFSASPFSSSRLDLFNSTSTLRTGHLDPIRPPAYLLRPYAQKVQVQVQPSPFTSSTSNTSSSGNNMNTSNSNSSNNFQLLSDQLGLPKQTQNLANMQNTSSNPILTFQSLLQSTIQQKFPVPSSSGAYVGENSNTPRMGALEEFHNNTEQLRTHLNELPSFVTPQGMLLRNNSIDDDQAHVRPPNDKRSDQNVVSSSGGRGGGGGGEGMVDSWICSSD